MAHKYEHISTGGGFSVLNNGVKKEVISQEGVIKGEIEAENGLAALLQSGVGVNKSYSKTSNLTNATLMDGKTGNRVALVAVSVDETFNDGEGTAPSFTIGVEGGTTFVNGKSTGTKGDVSVYAITIPTTKKIQISATPATEDGTGAITVTVIALPATS